MTTNLRPVYQPVVRRYFFGTTSHVELECGHQRNEHERWAGADVRPGERARCFECEMVAAGLMPTEAQLAEFRAKYPADAAQY